MNKEKSDEMVKEFLKAKITSKDLMQAKKLDDTLSNPEPIEGDIPME